MHENLNPLNNILVSYEASVDFLTLAWAWCAISIYVSVGSRIHGMFWFPYPPRHILSTVTYFENNNWILSATLCVYYSCLSFPYFTTSDSYKLGGINIKVHGLLIVRFYYLNPTESESWINCKDCYTDELDLLCNTFNVCVNKW